MPHYYIKMAELYKLEVCGIVYLIDPNTSYAYTYDIADPTAIGIVQWENIMTPPIIQFFPNLKEIMDAKRNIVLN